MRAARRRAVRFCFQHDVNQIIRGRKKKAWNALQAFSQVAIAGSRQISLHGSVWVKGAIRHVGAEPTLLSE